jgi:transcriptional regulator NrdR family protein
VARVIRCPTCGSQAAASDESKFDVRGAFQGKPVRRCRACGTGLFIRFAGRPQVIDDELWARMQGSWAKSFPDG